MQFHSICDWAADEGSNTLVINIRDIIFSHIGPPRFTAYYMMEQLYSILYDGAALWNALDKKL